MSVAAARVSTRADAGLPLATAVDAANIGVVQQYSTTNILGILHKGGLFLNR